MLRFIGTLFSYINIIINISKFQDHNEFSTFSLNCLSRHIISKHASAVYAKHRQVLTNTRKSFLRKISVRWNKKISM